MSGLTIDYKQKDDIEYEKMSAKRVAITDMAKDMDIKRLGIENHERYPFKSR